jgi:hypothetical protein
MTASSRELVPLHAADLSSFAKALRRQLLERFERETRPPGHVELLNMLARAAGHRNLQSLQAAPPPRVPQGAAPLATTLTDTAQRALRLFDEHGRLMRWPIKYSTQRLLLWGLWMRFDGKRRYTEREVNEVLNAHHAFGDHCILRRELINMRLLERKPDGSEYRKVAARPEPEVAALLRALRARRG